MIFAWFVIKKSKFSTKAEYKLMKSSEYNNAKLSLNLKSCTSFQAVKENCF